MSLLVAHQQRCEVFSGEAGQPRAGLGRGGLGRLKGPHEVQARWVGGLGAIQAKGRFAGRAGGLGCSESGCGARCSLLPELRQSRTLVSMSTALQRPQWDERQVEVAGEGWGWQGGSE